MKIISKKYWKDINNFNKIRRFLLNQAEFGTNCAIDKHTKILKNIGENLYIGRYSKGQISAANIGGPIYRSVSNSNQYPHHPETTMKSKHPLSFNRALDYSVIVALCWFKHVRVSCKNANMFAAIYVIFNWHFYMLLHLCESGKMLLKPTTTCHITRKASINPRASDRLGTETPHVHWFHVDYHKPAELVLKIGTFLTLTHRAGFAGVGAWQLPNFT